jgi:ArsR family transcriptional regulator
MKTCRYLSIEVASVEDDDTDEHDLGALADTLQELEQLENELSLAQRWVQGRLSEVRERVAELLDDGDPRLAAEILAGLADGGATATQLSRRSEAPPEVIEDALETLATEGLVERDGEQWVLAD